MNTTKTTLRNENVYFEYRPEQGEVSFRDLKDYYNETSGFNKSKRGLKKAVEEIAANFTPETKFWHIVETFTRNKIRVHTYCAMD